MAEFMIPTNHNGTANLSKLDSFLNSNFSNFSESSIDLLSSEKYVAREVVNHIQPSFDYRVMSVGKKDRSYLIKVGAQI